MLWSLRFRQVLLLLLVVNVAVSYSMGRSPVFSLIVIIILTTSILVLQFAKRRA